MDLRGTAIVTGASSGIGRATALHLAAAGAHVALAARRAPELGAVADQIAQEGGDAIAFPTDVSRPAEIESLVRRTLDWRGGIDVLVNVAGIGRVHSVTASDDELERIVQVNLLAPIRLMRAVLPTMHRQGAGAIVNIGSIAGEIGVNGPYSATKFGLRGMTDSVRREVAGSGITVSLIEPGYIDTPLTAERSESMPGPEIVAAAVAALVKRPRRRVILPAKYRWLALLATVLPAAIDRQFAGQAATEQGRPAVAS